MNLNYLILEIIFLTADINKNFPQLVLILLVKLFEVTTSSSDILIELDSNKRINKNENETTNQITIVRPLEGEGVTVRVTAHELFPQPCKINLFISLFVFSVEIATPRSSRKCRIKSIL
jgi:hypothetical protein